MVNALKEYDLDIDVYDPWVEPKEFENEHGLTPLYKLDESRYDEIILAIGNKQFRNMSINDVRLLGNKKSVIYDLKYIFTKDLTDLRS